MSHINIDDKYAIHACMLKCAYSSYTHTYYTCIYIYKEILLLATYIAFIYVEASEGGL